MTRPAVRLDPLSELASNAFFYGYMLVATALVFAAAGFAAGMNAKRLRETEAFYQSLAEHDPLTGLYNARALRDFYRRAVERVAHRHEPLSILLIDVDRLKEINDCFGHLVGNQALTHVARAIREGKRADDAAARWGGDEFAILLEFADESAACRVAENILGYLHAVPLRAASTRIEVTVTIGIAVGDDISESDDLLATADRALYRGKQGGRDQLSVMRIGGDQAG
jgi:diguanylate cyclase (GGDEF)-like protein